MYIYMVYIVVHIIMLFADTLEGLVEHEDGKY